MLIKKKCSN